MTNEQFTIPGVGGIIESTLNGKPVILIQKRCKDTIEGTGVFEIPSGKIRAFENVFECLIREIKEETGLDVIKIEGAEESITIEAGEFKVISFVPFLCTQNIIGRYPIMEMAFICHAAGELSEETNESQDIQWIELETLRERLEKEPQSFFAMDIAIMKKYLDHKERT